MWRKIRSFPKKVDTATLSVSSFMFKVEPVMLGEYHAHKNLTPMNTNIHVSDTESINNSKSVKQPPIFVYGVSNYSDPLLLPNIIENSIRFFARNARVKIVKISSVNYNYYPIN